MSVAGFVQLAPKCFLALSFSIGIRVQYQIFSHDAFGLIVSLSAATTCIHKWQTGSPSIFVKLTHTLMPPFVQLVHSVPRGSSRRCLLYRYNWSLFPCPWFLSRYCLSWGRSFVLCSCGATPGNRRRWLAGTNLGWWLMTSGGWSSRRNDPACLLAQRSCADDDNSVLQLAQSHRLGHTLGQSRIDILGIIHDQRFWKSSVHRA